VRGSTIILADRVKIVNRNGARASLNAGNFSDSARFTGNHP
jgi:hypothetical protein